MQPTLPEGDAKSTMVRTMFDTIAHRYDVLNRFIALGFDMRWRKLAVRRLSAHPKALLLDLACGTGDFCRLLERQGYRVLGIDFSVGMLTRAKTKAALVQADVTTLPIRSQSVDGVTCGFGMRNFADLEGFFAEVARVCKPGARIALLDAGFPHHPILRMGHRVFFGIFVPLFAGMFSDRAAYQYLPRSLQYLPAPETMQDMLRAAGFTAIVHTPIFGGSALLLTATRDE